MYLYSGYNVRSQSQTSHSKPKLRLAEGQRASILQLSTTPVFVPVYLPMMIPDDEFDPGCPDADTNRSTIHAIPDPSLPT